MVCALEPQEAVTPLPSAAPRGELPSGRFCPVAKTEIQNLHRSRHTVKEYKQGTELPEPLAEYSPQRVNPCCGVGAMGFSTLLWAAAAAAAVSKREHPSSTGALQQPWRSAPLSAGPGGSAGHSQTFLDNSAMGWASAERPAPGQPARLRKCRSHPLSSRAFPHPAAAARLAPGGFLSPILPSLHRPDPV